MPECPITRTAEWRSEAPPSQAPPRSRPSGRIAARWARTAERFLGAKQTTRGLHGHRRHFVGIDAAVAQRRAPDKVTFDAAQAVGRRVGHATFPDAGESVFSPDGAGFGRFLARLGRHRPDPAAPVHARVEFDRGVGGQAVRGAVPPGAPGQPDGRRRGRRSPAARDPRMGTRTRDQDAAAFARGHEPPAGASRSRLTPFPPPARLRPSPSPGARDPRAGTACARWPRRRATAPAPRRRRSP